MTRELIRKIGMASSEGLKILERGRIQMQTLAL